MSKRIRIKHRFRYWFDNLMTGGTAPIIILLLLVAGLLTFIVTLFILLSYKQLKGEISHNPIEIFWETFMHLIDPGTIADDDNVGWLFRIFMLIPTTFGILLVATLVGVITSKIDNILNNLRKGHSLVLEKDHTVILGWSPKIFSIINELVKTNSPNGKNCIVILADVDKVFMEDEISEKVDKRGQARIICRNGDPIDLDDLDIVNPHRAKSIVVISNEESDADVQSIKCISAIVNHPNRKKEPYNIIVELTTDDHREIAQIAGGDEVTVITYSEVMARIIAQTCLDSDLSSVYTELLDFDNVDIYFADVPEFYHKNFQDTLMAYEDIIPIGILKNKGEIILNPKIGRAFESKDKVILIADDGDKLPPPSFAPRTIHQEMISQRDSQLIRIAKSILILGWNKQGQDIVQELINYLGEGSQVLIVANDLEDIQEDLSSLGSFRNIKIICQPGDITDRKTLNDLDIIRFSHIMILSYNERMSMQDADAHTYLTLLYLRNIKKVQKANFTIVSEILDNKNRTLARVSDAGDFIISDQIISLMISQIAENNELKEVYDELFDSLGTEVYLKPIERYLTQPSSTNFYTITAAAAQKQEIAIGYRLSQFARGSEKAFEVVLNPEKSKQIDFMPGDKIVVLAED